MCNINNFYVIKLFYRFNNASMNNIKKLINNFKFMKKIN